MKRTAVKLIGVVAILILAACGKDPDVNVTNAPSVASSGSATIQSIQVADSLGSPGPFALTIGQTKQLTPKALDASNNPITGISFVWTSSNTGTATVSSTGLVTAVALGGPVTITASSGTVKSNDVNVTISCAGIPSNSPTPMTLTLNPASPITVNATTGVTAKVYDCNGNPVPDNTSVTFTLNVPSLGNLTSGSTKASTLTVPTAGGAGIASVSFTAGTTAGNVTITAAAGTVSASAPLVIQALPVLGIQFLQANPQVIGVKGSGQTEVSEVSFSVTDTQGKPIGDGTVIKLQFLNGMNPGGGAAIDPPTVATVGGVAKTFVKSGFVAGPVRVLAFLDANNNGILDAGEVYSTSTPLSIGGGIPSARFFSISADVHNLAGLAYDNQVANINVNMADRFGNYNVLQGTSVSFYTEAGAIDRQGKTNDKGQTTVVFRTQNPMPIDTDPRQNLNPIGNELFLYNNLNCNGFDPLTEGMSGNYEDLNGNGAHDNCEHFKDLNGNGYDLGEPNPRDGWATILAVTQGEEAFYDTNGNGVYDPGEPFDDNGGEPFIDANDNGIYDGPEVFIDTNNNKSYDFGEPFYDRGTGEPFLDTNGNGVYDSTEPFSDINGNGVYDGPGDAMLVDPFGRAPGGTAPCLDKTTGAPKSIGCTRSGFYDFVYNPGEFFVDIDGDRKWTPPNGKWDANTTIWVDLRSTNQKVKKSQTMVFTGAPQFSPETSKIVIDESHRDPRPGRGSNYWIHNGECVNMEVHVADINNNAPIPGTTVALTVDQGKLFGTAAGTIPDNGGGGPYITVAQVCDDDASKIEMKSSSLKVDITWKPQNVASALTQTMAVTGIKDAPLTVSVTIVTSSLPNTPVTCAGTPPTLPCYNQQLVASGGAAPYTWTMISGVLPPTFVINPSGLITQTGVSAAGTYSFTVQAADVLGTLSATRALSITLP